MPHDDLAARVERLRRELERLQRDAGHWDMLAQDFERRSERLVRQNQALDARISTLQRQANQR
ncbi:hypothetical protein JDV02_008938 [Purpureocillium takamizusanense]|uniref:Uncharacterized protein n=1 Tax=Purpureocillium takamizusanense TaxID=2060973 RepID=A0A9Q8QQU9_9HYPO|nr:uncharacterized protein JDV02_008938 [Purpureocillium takamizusanense]UNI23099.1 hypothetical protein JDV02_008938 [Purpureocillium takamizusanense]